MQNLPGVADLHDALERDVRAVGNIGAVPSMLKMICDETGMGFAAVARVTDATWTACAVQDNVGFGLKPLDQLDLHTTLCFESRAARAKIAVDRFSESVIYKGHHTPRIYGLESYISVPIVLPNGEYFGNLCAIDASPADVSASHIVRMFEVFANLIAMQLDGARQQASVEAQLADERRTAGLREQFIAVLGHDLRNPLSAFSATAEILCRRNAEPELVAVGHRLKRTVARMAKLIDDVMDFARGRLGGGIPMSIEPVADLTSALRSVVEELCDGHPSCRVECTFAVTATVECDSARLQQLLSNLLANAFVHGEPGAPVRVLAAVDEQDFVLSVSNEGPPIPGDVAKMIFEPYWRPATSKPGGGLGLGLFICNQIVTAHRGTLSVVSAEGEGTVFTARIPKRR